MAEEFTDGKLHCWPCNVSIIGNNSQGYDVQTAPYTIDDRSAPVDTGRVIENCDKPGFKTKQQARHYVEKCGFVPDTKWGEMT